MSSTCHVECDDFSIDLYEAVLKALLHLGVFHCMFKIVCFALRFAYCVPCFKIGRRYGADDWCCVGVGYLCCLLCIL